MPLSKSVQKYPNSRLVPSSLLCVFQDTLVQLTCWYIILWAIWPETSLHMEDNKHEQTVYIYGPNKSLPVFGNERQMNNSSKV